MPVSTRKDIRIRTLAEENGSPTRKDIVIKTQAQEADTGGGGGGGASGSGAEPCINPQGVTAPQPQVEICEPPQGTS